MMADALLLAPSPCCSNPQHRANLEAYARYLAGRRDEQALYFFQKSVMTYFEHSHYRGE